MGTDVQSREIGSPAVTRAIVRLAAQGLECGVDRRGTMVSGKVHGGDAGRRLGRSRSRRENEVG